MSYILDALKKIEHEKNKKPAPDGRVSIAGDLFHERTRPPARSGIWKIAAVIAVASLATAAGTWFMLRGDSNKSTAVIRPVVSAPVSSAPVTPPVVTPPVSTRSLQPSTPVAVPQAVPTNATPARHIKTESVDNDEDESAQSERRINKQQKIQSPSPQQPVQTVQAPADIKLSGIAWQDERAGRRAVINGFLLKEGAVVSGAKITDIYANRVRLSSPAGQFEIRLDALLPAEVKK